MNNPPNCPIPSKRSLSIRQTFKTVATFDLITWMRAIFIGAATALLIGIPTVLIPNPLFQRMIPTTPIDYVFYVISVLIIGITWAIPIEGKRDKGDSNHPADHIPSSKEKQSVFGLIATIFAVGCPTCNQLVLLLLGTGGAMTYFAPLQPVIGLIAVALLFIALMRRTAQSTLPL